MTILPRTGLSAKRDVANALQGVIPAAVRFMSTVSGSFGECEQALLTALQEGGRVALEQDLRRIEDALPAEVTVGSDKRSYRAHQPEADTYPSLFGGIEVRRRSFREVGVRNGPTVIALELSAGLVEGATPTFAYNVAEGYGLHDIRKDQKVLASNHRHVPPRATLERLAGRLAARIDEQVPAIEPIVRASSRPSYLGSEAVQTRLDPAAITPYDDRYRMRYRSLTPTEGRLSHLRAALRRQGSPAREERLARRAARAAPEWTGAWEPEAARERTLAPGLRVVARRAPTQAPILRRCDVYQPGVRRRFVRRRVRVRCEAVQRNTTAAMRRERHLAGRDALPVGRFRKFVEGWDGGWRPAQGDGKHVHLNGGQGLSDSGNAGGHGPGWNTAWSSNLATTSSGWDSNLSCISTYQIWTGTPGSNERRPINCESWYEAYAFCVWDGGFLPSEAEWNYVAAGGSEQRAYPWSSPPTSNTIDCTYANYENGSAYCVAPPDGGTNDVGSESTTGDGKWGQTDLAGNVWEWNVDFYATAYAATCDNCARLAPAGDRMVRGGGFDFTAAFTLAAERSHVSPANRSRDLGLRYARVP